jgi:hypothetical protein
LKPAFSRAKGFGAFTSQSPLEKSQALFLGKPVLNLFSDPRKKTSMQKPALPNYFLLGPKGVWWLMGFWEIGVFEAFASWDFGHEANSKSAKGPKVVRGPHGDGPKPGNKISCFEKPIGSESKMEGKQKGNTNPGKSARRPCAWPNLALPRPFVVVMIVL